MLHLFKFFPISRTILSIYNGDSLNINPFDDIPASELGFVELSRSSKVIFSYLFLHRRLFDSDLFQYSQVLVIFLFSHCFDSFLSWLFFIPSAVCLLQLFIMSMTCFHCQILLLYPGCIFLLFVSGWPIVFIFSKYLDNIYILWWLILWFCKFVNTFTRPTYVVK